MIGLGRIGACLLAVAALSGAIEPAQAQMTAPNPYQRFEGIWGRLPQGRTWGATSAVFTSPDGNIWVAERCGANSCTGSNLDPILLFDPTGRLLRSFGAGLFAWPHGIFVDREGNVWVADAAGLGETPQGLGHVVYKFSPDGKLLMTLGKRGVAGSGPDTFNKPTAVLVAPDGSIFVADGHDAGGNNRIVKFAPDGTFLKEWGSTGCGPGQFRDPHSLAMDSQGRLFVADRGNNRIQIFDQEGNHLATWTQFGRPSGLFIDRNDILYATDSESNSRRNPGWRRGIYIGSARTGWVTAFIPDPEPDPDNSATSGAEGVAVDLEGNVYGAEVGPRMLRKYLKRGDPAGRQ
jgi:DNA-binding beta-propeller fold protein YncE